MKDRLFTLLEKASLRYDGGTYEFEGKKYPGATVSFYWVDLPPGGGFALHKHPYEEIFIIEEGTATYTVGEQSMVAHAGQVIIVPAETPHKFVNTGSQALKQVDILAGPEIITVWLE